MHFEKCLACQRNAENTFIIISTAYEKNVCCVHACSIFPKQCYGQSQVLYTLLLYYKLFILQPLHFYGKYNHIRLLL